MTLPRLLVLTDRTQSSFDLPATVAVAVEHGARAVVLREKDLPAAERDRLASSLAAVLDPVGGLLIMAGSEPGSRGALPMAESRRPAAWESVVDGVHLAAADPFPARRPLVVGRSCHDAAELARAGADGCDYVTLSPVYPSASKPGYGPVLGPAGLAALTPLASPLVFALGGVTPDLVAPCLDAGAHGVAVMGAIMREPSLVADYLSILEEA